jgi:hypothetical protein
MLRVLLLDSRIPCEDTHKHADETEQSVAKDGSVKARADPIKSACACVVCGHRVLSRRGEDEQSSLLVCARLSMARRLD